MRETKLAYLLTRIGLNADQRTSLCTHLGISERTFYQRRNDPGTFTLDEAASLNAWLEKTTGEAQDVFRLYRELVEVTATTAA